MGKSIEKTPAIEASIRRAINDPNADISNFSVFEANAVTTLPLRKAGFYKDGRISRGVLGEMADLVNQKGQAIPMHIMHMASNDLPLGRVFEAALVDDPTTGETSLRSLFYIPNTDPEKAKLITDIENSIIDEVSVSILTKHATCSECGWDYYGEDASFINFFALTCDNGHEIGKDGVHVRLNGLDKWFELSLVNRGGAQDAKILSRARQSLGQDGLEKMAASGEKPLDVRLLTLTEKMTPSKEEVMDLKELVEKVTTLSSDLGQANLKLEGMTKDLAAKDTQLAEKDKKIEEMTAALGDTAKVQTELEAAKAETAKLVESLTTHVTAALTASGEEAKDLPKDPMGLLKLAEDKGLKLHQLMGAGTGGKSNGKKVDDNSEVDNTAARRNAFKVS